MANTLAALASAAEHETKQVRLYYTCRTILDQIDPVETGSIRKNRLGRALSPLLRPVRNQLNLIVEPRWSFSTVRPIAFRDGIFWPKRTNLGRCTYTLITRRTCDFFGCFFSHKG